MIPTTKIHARLYSHHYSYLQQAKWDHATYAPENLKSWKRKAKFSLFPLVLKFNKEPSFPINWHLWLLVIWAKRQKSIDTDMCINHAYKCEYMTMILWNFNVASFFSRKRRSYIYVDSFYNLRFALSNCGLLGIRLFEQAQFRFLGWDKNCPVLT